MSFAFDARFVCEEALRKIGAFSINDTAADPEHVRIALNWLDIDMAELAGTDRCWWLVPATLTLPLNKALTDANPNVYDVASSLGTEKPENGIQFPVEARVVTLASGNGRQIPILRRDQYEGVRNKMETGHPRAVYFDRFAGLMYLVGVPAQAGVLAFKSWRRRSRTALARSARSPTAAKAETS